MFLMFMALIIFILFGFPMAFVMGLAPLAYVVAKGDYSIILSLVQKMFTGADKSALLCIPLFMLGGKIMNQAGITQRIIAVCQSTIGLLRGGLAYVNVLASMIFAGITGSALADTSAIGGILIPAMTKKGYEKDFAAAVTVASSCIGPIIPPSMLFILYAFVSNVSIGALFLAGFIPGIMLGLSQMLLVHYYSQKRNYPREKFRSIKYILRISKDAILALLMPLIIIGGILSGIFTATEAAAAAVIYALLVGSIIYRNLTFSGLIRVLIETGIESAAVLLILAFASAFAWVITIENIPVLLANYLLRISSNPNVILMIINLLLLFIGTWMDATPALMIMAPILVPVVTSMGVNPVHFGIIMCLNLTIGLITPPLGPCLFIASIISKISVEEIFRATIPFFIVNVIALFIVTYFPAIVMFIPRIFGF